MLNESINLSLLDTSVLFTNNFEPLEPCVVGITGFQISFILVLLVVFLLFVLWFITRITKYEHKITTNKWLFFIVVRLLIISIMLTGVLFYYTTIFYK